MPRAEPSTTLPAVPGPDPERDLVVVGLARNCARTLDEAVAVLVAALPPARRVRWLVIESDSDDDTAAVLQRLRATVPDFDYRSLGRLQDRLPLRTQRIAHCRNAYLDILRSDPERERFGHIIVADLDGASNQVTAAGLLSCWQSHDWAVCTANQAGPYFDICALRHPEWCSSDCWRQDEFLKRHGIDTRLAELASSYARMITIAEDSDWIEVDSAFGGLAVYRAEALLAQQYVGISVDGGPVCEHVSLHAGIRAGGGRIFINPRLVVGAASEHATYWQERR